VRVTEREPLDPSPPRRRSVRRPDPQRVDQHRDRRVLR